MIPVEQVRQDDCFSACVASILELPLEEVAYFPTQDLEVDAWMTAWVLWLDERGYDLYGGIVHPFWKRPEGYWILSAESPRLDGKNHAVVCKDGEIVWDPHPERDMGVGKWVAWYQIEKENA